ncbi:hypothetical protein ZEAMMB73_Zm00001d030974 [Zea mays]|uniref:Uncharacterized protein n=1 Tax=Zea mays TaxID=4577 RepID=A0A1D6KFF8_MAIZE|nr:hypothetical protein ZEAMMB73_Zm00001d030974 [Zea mays]
MATNDGRSTPPCRLRTHGEKCGLDLEPKDFTNTPSSIGATPASSFATMRHLRPTSLHPILHQCGSSTHSSIDAAASSSSVDVVEVLLPNCVFRLRGNHKSFNMVSRRSVDTVSNMDATMEAELWENEFWSTHHTKLICTMGRWTAPRHHGGIILACADGLDCAIKRLQYNL